MTSSAAPGWPLLDYATCWAAGPNSPTIQSCWSSLATRTEGSMTVTRGKTYELDQVQPGEIQDLTLRNDDGQFDPSNSLSPWYPYVIPYRLFRLRAQYPATVNLLTQNQATAGQATEMPAPVEQPISSGLIPVSANVTSAWFATIVPNGSAYVGSQVFATNVPASQNLTNPQVIAFAGASVTPGQAYSGQIEACCRTSGVNPTVKARIQFFTASGASLGYFGTAAPITLTGASGTTWTEITVTNAVAPVNAAGMALVLNEATPGPSSAHVIQTSGAQLEANTTCSAFTTPGTWYPMFTGYIERWTQSWSSGGNYGTVDLDIVDYFAFLAQRPLNDPFTMDLLALDPNFLYPLNEASGSSVFNDVSGNRPQATIVQTQVGSTLAAGQDIEANDNAPQGPDQGIALTGAFLGGAGPALQSNATGGSYYQLSNTSYVAIPANPSTELAGPPQSGAFTRLCAVRLTGLVPQSVGGSEDVLVNPYFMAFGSTTESLAALQVQLINPAANPGDCQAGLLAYVNENEYVADIPGLGPLAECTNTTNYTFKLLDSDWHLYGFSLAADRQTFHMFADMSESSTTLVAPSPLAWTGYDVLDVFGGSLNFLIGDIAFVTELPFAVTGTQWADLALSWRNAWGGTNPATGVTESSDTRYERILAWAGYTGPTNIQPGSSVDYGPATDIAGGANATYALNALQSVVDSEAGQHFVDAAGTVTFQARDNRYNPVSIMTFGENTAAGETPYLSATVDFDPTLVGNDIEVDAQFNDAAYYASDATSIANYGDIGIQRTVNSLSAQELGGAAQNLLYESKDPLLRLEALPVDVGANPAAWADLLALELSFCVTVNRRPSNAPQISTIGFVEQIVWTIADDRTVSCQLQISSAAKHFVGELNSSSYGEFDETLIFAF